MGVPSSSKRYNNARVIDVGLTMAGVLRQVKLGKQGDLNISTTSPHDLCGGFLKYRD